MTESRHQRQSRQSRHPEVADHAGMTPLTPAARAHPLIQAVDCGLLIHVPVTDRGRACEAFLLTPAGATFGVHRQDGIWHLSGRGPLTPDNVALRFSRLLSSHAREQERGELLTGVPVPLGSLWRWVFVKLEASSPEDGVKGGVETARGVVCTPQGLEVQAQLRHEPGRGMEVWACGQRLWGCWGGHEHQNAEGLAFVMREAASITPTPQAV